MKRRVWWAKTPDWPPSTNDCYVSEQTRYVNELQLSEKLGDQLEDQKGKREIEKSCHSNQNECVSWKPYKLGCKNPHSVVLLSSLCTWENAILNLLVSVFKRER